jgi:hypothetical protein
VHEEIRALEVQWLNCGARGLSPRAARRVGIEPQLGPPTLSSHGELADALQVDDGVIDSPSL